MDGVLVSLFFFSFVSMKNIGTCYMDAWNNVLYEHCDVNVICMDGTLFLIMYVCCHGWSYVLDTSYVCYIYINTILITGSE